MATKWDIVKERMENAHAIAWDNCHKIYLLMDDEQVAEMRRYGYETLITTEQASQKLMLALVREWYKRSCFLKFVSAVTTDQENPNAGFETLIGQL